MLAKIGKENRAMIGAEEKAIFFLNLLLRSPNPTAQENAVTALLNLSIHEANKTRIINQPGCLRSIVRVLRSGLTPESKENAAATLFSLSAVHEYRKLVVEEPRGVEALVRLLNRGSLRGKKDAVMALLNLSTLPESWERMVGSGAGEALVGAVVDGEEEVAEEAAGAPAVAERVGRVPGVRRVVQRVAVEGTKRARRKAAGLARLLERREWGTMYMPVAAAAGGRGADLGGERNEEITPPVAVPVAVL
ncbi:U-box domain-containing protein 17-like [Phalaenopsis equestris]|uniref:U-box domain-containing protein 17-like n=1 Tax=Phalaenopsis equestris TaxID=78828 RepID=UPI0009E1FB1D|nr:U-box domain-containing protein 17-like [Phalaenopsis equestris]